MLLALEDMKIDICVQETFLLNFTIVSFVVVEQSSYGTDGRMDEDINTLLRLARKVAGSV